MRTDQRRYFGHPDLVMFIQRLSSQVSNLGMGTVLIGDMGMPAGGRFNGGHASHQTDWMSISSATAETRGPPRSSCARKH